MIGPGQPHYRHRPFPPKPGLSPLIIVLIVLGGMLVLGGGACVVLSAIVVGAASAEQDPAVAAPPSTRASRSPPTVNTPSLTPIGEEDAPPSRSPAQVDTPSSSSGSAAAPVATITAGGNWSCTASASVRVCGFAGACNFQMVFGNGFGKDRFLAQQQAKNSCEAMARAKGSPTVCLVQCTVR